MKAGNHVKISYNNSWTGYEEIEGAMISNRKMKNKDDNIWILKDGRVISEGNVQNTTIGILKDIEILGDAKFQVDTSSAKEQESFITGRIEDWKKHYDFDVHSYDPSELREKWDKRHDPLSLEELNMFHYFFEKCLRQLEVAAKHCDYPTEHAYNDERNNLQDLVDIYTPRNSSIILD